MSPIQAVTFDLWDTIVLDDSDEPKRTELGLPSKPEQRRILVHESLSRHRAIDRQQIDTAYDATDAAFRQAWYGKNVTWTVTERLGLLLDKLARTLPDGEFAELVRLHEEMELEVKPELVPGAREAIEALKGVYRLGVISDAIFSPGRTLRQLLEHYSLLEHFDSLIFSDEIGCSKPDARAFEEAAADLRVPPETLVHLGDREEKDIGGPHQVGARGVLIRVACDRGGSDSRADAVCDDFAELPEILEKLNSVAKGTRSQ